MAKTGLAIPAAGRAEHAVAAAERAEHAVAAAGRAEHAVAVAEHAEHAVVAAGRAVHAVPAAGRAVPGLHTTWAWASHFAAGLSSTACSPAAGRIVKKKILEIGGRCLSKSHCLNNEPAGSLHNGNENTD